MARDNNESARGVNGALPLTRERIARTALSMADEIGLEKVSMRKLAAELGVTAMALYRYFGSIDEIRVAVVAQAFAEVDSSPIPGERWDATLRRTTASIREMNLRHATANLTMVEMSGDAPAMVEHTQRIYALHEAQGIPEDILRKIWRIVDAFLGGFMECEIQEIRAAWRAESVGDEPAAAWRKTAEGAYSDESFNDGMDIIIAGVRALAAPDPCDWRTPEEAQPEP